MNILTYKCYQAYFEYDEDTAYFHCMVLPNKGMINFQGHSIDELEQALVDSVEEYCY